MRAHLLIDLDNLLDPDATEPVTDLEQRIAALAPNVRRVLVNCRQCTVSIAMNTDTAIRAKLSFEQVRAHALWIASHLGYRASTQAAVEIGLALTMPQAADVLLERLARESPTTGGAGQYQLAVLASKDIGLLASLTAAPYGRWKPTPWSLGRILRPLLEDAGTIRKPPPPPVLPTGPKASVDSDAYTIVVHDGPGAGAWIRDRHCDIDTKHELWELASAADENPWLLTQIGSTSSSLRGLERLARLPGHGPLGLGPMAVGEILEVRGDRPKPIHVESPCETASVGPGAIRFPAARATVPSKLPAAVLEHVCRPIPVYPIGIPTRRALDELSYYEICDGSVSTSVSLRRIGHDLVARVDRIAPRPLGSWWIRQEHALSELRLNGLGELLPEFVTSRCWPMRAGPGDHYALAFGIRLAADSLVSAKTQIDRGTIGQARITGDGLQRDVAVWALTRSYGPRETIAARPIHEVDFRQYFPMYPPVLSALPLLAAVA